MDDVFKIILAAFFMIILIGCGVMIFNQPTENVSNDATINEVIQEKVDDLNDGGTVKITNAKEDVTYTISSSKANSNSNANTNANANSNSKSESKSESVSNVVVGEDKSDSGVQGGHVAKNSQEDKGYYYQINYNDGNFRQYDTKTGNLIGSTFEEDQAKLSVSGAQMV